MHGSAIFCEPLYGTQQQYPNNSRKEVQAYEKELRVQIMKEIGQLFCIDPTNILYKSKILNLYQITYCKSAFKKCT